MDRNEIIAAAARQVAAGAFGEALVQYRRLLDAEPKDVRVLQKLGELFQKKNDPTQAAEHFSRAAEQYAAVGFHLHAVALYKLVLGLEPSRITVHLELARLYERLMLPCEAMAHLQIAADRYAEIGDTGALRDALKKMSELRGVLSLMPEEPPAHREPVTTRLHALPLSGPVTSAAPRAAGGGGASRARPLRVNLVRGVKADGSRRQPRGRDATSSVKPTEPRRSLEGLLLREGLIDPSQLLQATEARLSGESVQTALVRTGAIEESALLGFLGQQFGVPGVNLDDLDIDPAVRALIPQRLWATLSVFPVNVAGPSLIVAMRNPADLAAIDVLRFLTGRSIEPVVTSEPSLFRTIERYCPSPGASLH